MSEYRDSSSNNLLSLISGAFIGAAGLAWWLISEADKRKEEKKQKAMNGCLPLRTTRRAVATPVG